jgi:hypothetical protein
MSFSFIPVLALFRGRNTKPRITQTDEVTTALFSFLGLKVVASQLVAHACNLSCLGDKDQVERSLRPAWATISKKPITKTGWWSGSRFRP